MSVVLVVEGVLSEKSDSTFMIFVTLGKSMNPLCHFSHPQNRQRGSRLLGHRKHTVLGAQIQRKLKLIPSKIPRYNFAHGLIVLYRICVLSSNSCAYPHKQNRTNKIKYLFSTEFFPRQKFSIKFEIILLAFCPSPGLCR